MNGREFGTGYFSLLPGGLDQLLCLLPSEADSCSAAMLAKVEQLLVDGLQHSKSILSMEWLLDLLVSLYKECSCNSLLKREDSSLLHPVGTDLLIIDSDVGEFLSNSA